MTALEKILKEVEDTRTKKDISRDWRINRIAQDLTNLI